MNNIIYLSLFLFASCQSNTVEANSFINTKNIPMFESNNNNNSSDLNKYQKHYNLDFKELDFNYQCGYLTIAKQNIFLQVFKPKPKYQKIVILSHGFWDHGALFKYLIKELLKQNILVAVMDFTGHGLSDGKKSWIDDFNKYFVVYNKIFSFVKENYQQDKTPIIAIGHSMGCVPIMNFINHNPQELNQAIFLAPLVLHRYNSLSKFMVKYFSWVSSRWKGGKKKYTNDQQFNEFLFNDKLRGKFVYTDWAEALYKWQREKFHKYKLTTPLLVLQGKKDKIVDWQDNILLLKKVATNLQINYFDKAYHHIHNEEKKIRDNVFKSIFDFIKE